MTPPPLDPLGDTAIAQRSGHGVPALEFGLSAIYEACGLWLWVLPLATLCMAWVVHWQQGRELESLRDARLHITLLEIRDRLEADLALGLELADNGRAQGLLEQALTKDAGLRAIEVFDVQGVSLFNTDRASIHEKVPGAWMAVAFDASSGATPAESSTATVSGVWRQTIGRDPVLGLPLRGPFGEAVGALAVTAAPAPAPDARGLWTGALLGMVLITGAGLLVARGRLRRLVLGDEYSAAQLEKAARRLTDTQQRLERGLLQLAQADAADAHD